MSKLLSLVRRAPKRTSAVFAMIAAAVVVPAALLAWGPTDRPTFTADHPADHVTFDSITDNPDYGDERNFVRIKDASDTSAGNWKDSLAVQPGKEYLVQMYVHNNAASSLNLVANNTRVMANIPTNTAKSIDVNGFITADNATPKQIWDQATFTSSTDFNLAYVPGSAMYYNNVFGPSGIQLSDSIVTSAGALVGYDKLDGKVPGCFNYSGYVSFKVKAQVAQTANFTVSKEVSKHGANNWVENYAAKPGETVDYLIEYKNIGQAQQDNVMVKDTLPTGESYVNGTTVLGNAQHPAGLAASDNITQGGINIGSYATNGTAWVIFSAKVADNDQLPTCGVNNLVNTARVETDYGYKEDTAGVTVNKECQTPPVYTCDALTKNLISGTKYSFEGKASASNGASIVSYTYDFGDGQTQTVTTSGTSSSATHEYPTTGGTYNVKLNVTFNVNGTTKTISGDNCATIVTIPKPTPPVYTCDALTKTLVSDTTYKFDGKASASNGATIVSYGFDFGDGHNQTVTTTGGTASATHTYPTTGGVYNAVLTVTFTVNGTTKTATSTACATTITVTPPASPVYTCDALTKTLVSSKDSTTDTYSFNGKASASNGATVTGYTLDFGDGKSFTGATVANVTHDYAQDGKTYTAKLTATVLVNGQTKTVSSADCTVSLTTTSVQECKPGIPMGDTRCNETSECKPGIPMGDTRCNETPTTPPVLPQTGAGENFTAVLGLGSLIASISYYVASRRGILGAFKK